MLKIGILGVGQAGGNIAELAYTHGFVTGAINFRKDLESLEKIKNKYAIPKGFGAGKNRDIGISSVKEYYSDMLRFVEEKFIDVDILYVASSLGGGTGSGTAPILIDLLIGTMSCPVGAIIILPDTTEDFTAQSNTSIALAEITNLEGLATTFIIDNEKARNSKPGLSKKELYDYANKYMIEGLVAVNNATTMNSNLSNFDPEDLKSILSTGGFTIISHCNLTEPMMELNAKQVAEQIMNSWDKTVFPNISYGKIQKAGMIYHMGLELIDRINHDLIFRETGKPLTVYTGYYPKGTGTIISILSGMEYPFERFNALDTIIEENKDSIEKSVTKNRGYESRGGDWYKQTTSKKAVNSGTDPGSKENQKLSLIEKMKKYGN